MSFSFTELILFTERSNECQQKGNSRDWVSGSRQEENRTEGMPLSASAEGFCEGENGNSLQMCISVTVFQKMSFLKLSLQRQQVGIY